LTSESEQAVNVAECVEVVRALVAAFEAKGERLTRVLKDEYAPESHLLPWRFEISTELIERGLKALGLPAPEAPKPKKIPARPTDAQARVLDYLNAHTDARLKSWQGWGWKSHYGLTRPDGDEVDVAKGTYEKLQAYKWIEYERNDGGYRPTHYYKLTDAGREALTRYQMKVGVV
jgi:hypothetical protein